MIAIQIWRCSLQPEPPKDSEMGIIRLFRLFSGTFLQTPKKPFPSLFFCDFRGLDTPVNASGRKVFRQNSSCLKVYVNVLVSFSEPKPCGPRQCWSSQSKAQCRPFSWTRGVLQGHRAPTRFPGMVGRKEHLLPSNPHSISRLPVYRQEPAQWQQNCSTIKFAL